MEENNKIIAEFMRLNKTKMFFNLKSGNYVKKETDDCDIKAVDVYLKNNKPITNFYYHSDWNWLMEVVEKIESISFEEDNFINVTIGCGFDCTIQDAHGKLFELSTWEHTKIKTVYNACVEFIKWYNENGAKNN